jgi:hypothetical protein
MYDEQSLWLFLPIGYLLTVAIELPILWLLLSRRHAPKVRLTAGFLLTAVTYPIVVIVMPLGLGPDFTRAAYLAIAETFAPGAECLLFYFAYVRDLPSNRPSTLRDFAAITVANLASFGAGELYWYLNPAY